MSLTRGLNRILTRDLTIATPPYIRNQGAAAGGGPTDEHFADVVFLSDCEGADAATSLTEQSSGSRVCTFAGNAAISNTQKKFGDTRSRKVENLRDWKMSRDKPVSLLKSLEKNRKLYKAGAETPRTNNVSVRKRTLYDKLLEPSSPRTQMSISTVKRFGKPTYICTTTKTVEVGLYLKENWSPPRPETLSELESGHCESDGMNATASDPNEQRYYYILSTRSSLMKCYDGSCYSILDIYRYN